MNINALIDIDKPLIFHRVRYLNLRNADIIIKLKYFSNVILIIRK